MRNVRVPKVLYCCCWFFGFATQLERSLRSSASSFLPSSVDLSLLGGICRLSVFPVDSLVSILGRSVQKNTSPRQSLPYMSCLAPLAEMRIITTARDVCTFPPGTTNQDKYAFRVP